MTIQHNTITDPEIHEPKGVAAASSGTVYKADGTGSGSWSYPLTGLNTASSGQVFVSDGSASGTWKYSPAKPHAEIYISGGTTAHTLSSTAGTYTKLNPSGEWTASGYEDILSVDATNGEIDLSLDGHYLLNFWINFTTSAIAAGTVYKFKYALDGTTAARTITVPKFSNGADTLHSSASGLLEVTGGSTVPLSLHVAGDATSAGEDITVVEAGLTVLFLD
jgi:hypothetical protein